MKVDPSIGEKARFRRSGGELQAGMENPTFKQRLSLLVGLLLLSPLGNAALIYESTSTANVPNAGGFGVTETSFLGVRFTLTQPTQITAIGGILSAPFSPATFFGAIVQLTSLSDLPNGTPFDGTEVLASGLYSIVGNGDRVLPLSVALSPGVYGLVYGQGALGDPGVNFATMYQFNTPINPVSGIAWTGTTWANAAVSGARFTVFGEPIPEPGTALFGGAVLGVVAMRRNRGYRQHGT